MSKTLKIVFIAPLFNTQHERESVEIKLAILLVVSLGKPPNKIASSLCSSQRVGQQPPLKNQG